MKAVNNLQKALKDQHEEDLNSGVAVGTSDYDFPGVQTFLGSISLENKYYNKFVENGIEDMETILELKQEIGVYEIKNIELQEQLSYIKQREIVLLLFFLSAHIF